MIGSLRNYQNGSMTQSKNIIWMVSELIQLWKYLNGSGINSELLLVYSKLVKLSMEIQDMLLIIKTIQILSSTIHYIIQLNHLSAVHSEIQKVISLILEKYSQLQNILLLLQKITIIQDGLMNVVIELNSPMLLFSLLYGKVFQYSITLENNIMLVVLIQITENLYGIIIIPNPHYINFQERPML